MIKHQTRIKTLLLLFTLLFPCTVSVCSDDKSFAWKPSPDKDVLKCENMQNKNNVCNKEVLGLNREKYPNKVKVRDKCRMACGNCEFQCQDDCTDDTRFRWKNLNVRNNDLSCDWLKANGDAGKKKERLLEHCKTNVKDLNRNQRFMVNKLCPRVCGNCCQQ